MPTEHVLLFVEGEAQQHAIGTHGPHGHIGLFVPGRLQDAALGDVFGQDRQIVGDIAVLLEVVRELFHLAARALHHQRGIADANRSDRARALRGLLLDLDVARREGLVRRVFRAGELGARCADQQRLCRRQPLHGVDLVR